MNKWGCLIDNVYAYGSVSNSHYEKFPDGKVVCIEDEIPFEIPQRWEWARLGSIVEMNPRNKADDSCAAGYIPMTYIDAGYCSGFRFDTRKWGEVKSGMTHLADGDVAFAKITPCFQNRKSMILSGLPNGIAGGTTELNVLRPYGETMIREYLLYFVKTHYFIGEASFKGTAGQQRVKTDYTEKKLIPIPSLAEQKRIVQKIVELIPVTEKYEVSQNALDKLNASIKDNLRKSTLQEAIQGKLVPQKSTDGHASTLLERIRIEKQKLLTEGKLKKKDIIDSVIYKGEDNKYYEKIGDKCLDISEEVPFDIPESWMWVRLASIANLYTGNSISETEKRARYTSVAGKEYIGTKDVGFDHRINYTNGVAIPAKYLSVFRIASSGSVLMCIEGGSAGRKIAILEKDVCFGNKLCCFSPYVEIAQYIYYYLQSPSFFEVFQRNKTGIIGGVSVNTLKDLLIALPPKNEQIRIVAKIQSLKL